jgi:hypothetical protein
MGGCGAPDAREKFLTTAKIGEQSNIPSAGLA